MTQPVRRYAIYNADAGCGTHCVETHEGVLADNIEDDTAVYLATDYLALEADLLRANSNNTALYSSLERVIAERDAAIAERDALRAELDNSPHPIRTSRDPPEGNSEQWCLAWLTHESTPAAWFQRSHKVVREHPETYPYWMPWPDGIALATQEAG